MGISTGCFVKATPGLQVYDGLTIASWFINKREDQRARDFLAAAKTRAHQALKAELMKEEIAYAIMKGIDDTFDALDEKNYKDAAEYVAESAVKAIDEAFQQVVECQSKRGIEI